VGNALRNRPEIEKTFTFLDAFNAQVHVVVVVVDIPQQLESIALPVNGDSVGSERTNVRAGYYSAITVESKAHLVRHQQPSRRR
jgi:hypothetical protein